MMDSKIPGWLQRMVRQAKGRDLSQYGLLEQFFQETHVVEADKFDEHHFKSVREKASELHDLAVSRFADDESWFDLIQDEYLAFYKAQPEFRSSTEMKPSHRINETVLKKARSTKDWEELRTYTQLDQWTSAMAAVEFGTRLADLFDEEKELQQAQKNAQEAEKDLEELLDKLQNDQADLDDLDQALENYQNAVDQMQQQVDRSGEMIRQMVRTGVQQARDNARQSEELLAAFGTEPGELQRMPHEERILLAQRIMRSKKLKELADKVGRFVRLAFGEQARKIVHGVDEVHDVVMGADIQHVLPSELALLAEPETKMLFYKRFVEQELLQYELRGSEKVARGAIICMVDNSGSMGGDREIWAKGVALALLNIANKQNRDFYGIHFSSSYDPLKEWYFPRGKGQVNDVLDFAEYFYGGGTDFQKPISRGVEVLEKMFNEDGAQKGDLVLITDGESAVTDEWLDRYVNAKRDLAFRMYGCLIGTYSSTLEALSDDIYTVHELASAVDVKDMFGYI